MTKNKKGVGTISHRVHQFQPVWRIDEPEMVAKADAQAIAAKFAKKTFGYADKTLKDYRNEAKETRNDIVKNTFRGTNAYGGVAKNSVAALVSVQTGEADSILDN